MESSTFTGDELRLHLCSYAFNSDSPSLVPPVLQLFFDFRPSSRYFPPRYFPPPILHIWRDYRDNQDVWFQEVAGNLLTVLHRAGHGWSDDIPRLAASYCQYLGNVIWHYRAPYCRYIVVNTIITDTGRRAPHGAPHRGPTIALAPLLPRYRAGQLLVPAWPGAALVDNVVVLTEAQDRPRGGEGSSDPPERATAALAENIRVDIFGEREAEKAYADCTCSICLTDFKAGEKLLVLPCGHRFHPQCLESWLAINHTCPFCRLDLSFTVPVPMEE